MQTSWLIIKKHENHSGTNFCSTAALLAVLQSGIDPFANVYIVGFFCHMPLPQAAPWSTKLSIDLERMRLLVHQTNCSAMQKLFIHSFFLATLIHNDEILICNSNFLFSSKIVLCPRTAGTLPYQPLH